MSFQIEINKKIVIVELENRKNIKHCYMRVLKEDLIQIRANRYFTLHDARILVEKKFDWLEASIKKLAKNSLNEDEFLYLGEKRKLEDFRIKNLDLFYKKEIQKILPIFLEEFSLQMELYPTSLSFRKNKRTWGSCNYKNGLNFNILLMKFPLEVMKYVIVHELAHIKHKNHSKDFWNLVKKHCPNYKEIERNFKNFL